MMNQLINKILKESKENDDPFFQPKDILKREEKEKKKEEEILSKILIGLQNIKLNYENKNWKSKGERLFLQTFFKLHSNEEYNERHNGYLLKDENDKIICLFELKGDTVWVSYDDIWGIFEKKFHWDYIRSKSFIKDMLEKHFKLNEFNPIILW